MAQRSRPMDSSTTDDRRYTKKDDVEKPDGEQKNKLILIETIRSSCKRLSFMEVLLLALLILAGFVIILLAAFLVVIRVSSFRYCTTAACAHQAGMVLAAMNTSANPCNDFYNYACGRWDQAYIAKPGVGRYSNFKRTEFRIQKLLYQLLTEGDAVVANKNSTSVAKAITFYKACSDMNRRNALGAKPLLDLITKLGGWTITTKPALRTSWDFLTTFIEMGNLGLALFPLSVSITYHPFNSSQYILDISIGGLSFSPAEMKSSNPKFKAAFMSFGRAVAKLIGNTGTSADLTSKLDKVWAFEKDLAEHETSPFDVEVDFLTVNQVQDKLLGSSFNFKKLLKSTLGYDFKGTEKVLVEDLKLVKYIAQKVKTMDKKVLANYMILRVINAMADKLSYSFAAAKMQKEKAISLESAIMQPTWKSCVEFSESYFPLQLTAMYADNFFNKKDKTDVEKMVLQIKEAMKHLITSAHWMDAPTRKVALAKLNYLEPSVAYPDNLFDLNQLDKHFASVQLNASTFFQGYLKIRRADTKESRTSLLKPVDRKEFLMSPLVANAYCDQSTVTIKILLGYIVNSDYDDLHFPISNLGALGSTIGHEMNHAFDPKGYQYDQHGNYHPWWSNETTKRFLQRTKCFIDQYSKYTFHGIKERGKYRVTENVADNGGMQASLLAFKMYKEYHGLNHGFLPGLPLSEKQLFFLAFAQKFCSSLSDAYAKYSMQESVHSVYPLRVLGVLSNTKEFAEAFQCPKGSVYNPSKKCLLW